MTSLSIHRQIGGWILDVRESRSNFSLPVVQVGFDEIGSRPDPITRAWDCVKAKRGLRIILLSMVSTVLSAATPWTPQDRILEGTFIAAELCDWGQTLDIAKRPGSYQEDNHLLGRHPSNATVNTYFAASIAAHALVANQLSGTWRTAWQAMWIGFEVGTVQRNYAIGIRFNF